METAFAKPNIKNSQFAYADGAISHCSYEERVFSYTNSVGGGGVGNLRGNNSSPFTSFFPLSLQSSGNELE